LSASALPDFDTKLAVLAFFDPPRPNLPKIDFAGVEAGAGTPIVEGAGLDLEEEFEGVVDVFGVVGTDGDAELETESRDERKPCAFAFAVDVEFEVLEANPAWGYASSPAGNTVLYSFVNFECAALRAYMHWK
jgi:hypothetical protein